MFSLVILIPCIQFKTGICSRDVLVKVHYCWASLSAFSKNLLNVTGKRCLTFQPSRSSSAEGDPYLLQWNALSAWFLGPRAENSHLFNKLVLRTFNQHAKNRRDYWPTDPAYIRNIDKLSKAYRSEKRQLKERLTEMNDELQQSTPIFSPRFQVRLALRY